MLIPIKDENPTRTFPAITISLILINLLAFIYQLSLGYGEAGQNFISRMGAIPYEITHFRDIGIPNILPPPLTLFSSIFLHGGITHIGGNMLYLWIFGNNIEDYLGKGRFLLFYIICGITAGLAQVIAIPDSPAPMIGASGAVAGILGAYAIIYPRAKVLTLFFLIIFIRLIYVPAIIILGFWFILQVLSAGGNHAGVAWYAHIGGFVAGIVLVKILSRRVKK